jgi:hypothetical protein
MVMKHKGYNFYRSMKHSVVYLLLILYGVSLYCNIKKIGTGRDTHRYGEKHTMVGIHIDIVLVAIKGHELICNKNLKGLIDFFFLFI